MMWLLFLAQMQLSEARAVEMGLASHPLLEVSHLQVASSKEDRFKAWSRHLPSVSINGQFRHSNFELTITQPVIIGFDPQTGRPIYREQQITFGYKDNYNLTLQTSLLLTGFGKSLYAAWMMDKRVKAQEARSRADSARLVINVRRAYQGALLARENLALAEEMLRIQNLHLEDARKRYQAGLIGEGELLRAELAVRNAEVERDHAQAQYAQALATLKGVLALPDTVEVELTDSLKPYPYPENPDSLLALLDARPDFQAMAFQIQAMEDLRKMHRARFLPTLSAFAFATYQKPYGFANTWGDQEGYGLQLSWSLFEGGGILSDYRKARIQRDILRKTLHFQKIQARNAFQGAYEKVKTAWEALKRRKAMVITSRRMLELTRQAYENGLLREVDFQDVALAYRQAQFGYLASMVQFNLAVLDLEMLVKGGGSR